MTQTATEFPEEPENPEASNQDDAGALIPAQSEISLRNHGSTIRQRWPFAAQDIKANMSNCTPWKSKVMQECFLWATDTVHPSTLEEFAKAVSYHPTTVGKVYRGKHVNPADGTRYDIPDDMAERAKEWLSRQKKQFKGRAEFVMTPTARSIWDLCELARESKTIGWVIGNSHIGKTWALENYSVHNNHGGSPFVRMETASGLGGMSAAIGRVLRTAEKGNTNDMKLAIINALSPDRLLILDEMHLLRLTYQNVAFFKCLETIREIHDRSGCPMVLCCTNLLMKELQPGQHKEMEQLLRRGPHKLYLPGMPTRGDLKVILSSRGLDFPARALQVVVDGHVEKPYALLCQLAKEEGLLSITERLRYAVMHADHAKKPVTWEHFIKVDLKIRAEGKPPEDWN